MRYIASNRVYGLPLHIAILLIIPSYLCLPFNLSMSLSTIQHANFQPTNFHASHNAIIATIFIHMLSTSIMRTPLLVTKRN